MAWATPSDIEARWIGDALPATATLVTLIADAEDTILGEFPDLQTRIDAGALPLARVVKVVARMVIRHLHNPTGLRSTQDGAGPFQRTTTWAGDEPGSMYLTAEDRRELGGGGSGRAFTIDATPPATPASEPDGFGRW